MRFALLLLAILISAPALAQGWTSYANARYGASADIPPGYVAIGTEASNSDGLTFAPKQRTTYITVYGADVPGKNFEAYIETMIANLHDFEGWSGVAKTVTPDWAELSAGGGHEQLRMRLLSSCNGRQAVVVKYYGLSLDGSIWSRLSRSLKAGPGRSC